MKDTIISILIISSCVGVIILGEWFMTRNNEAVKAQEAQWISENELTNEDIVQLSTVCKDAGLDFEFKTHYTQSKGLINVGVTCVAKQELVPAQTQNAGSSIDSETMSVGEYVGARVVMGLLGF